VRGSAARRALPPSPHPPPPPTRAPLAGLHTLGASLGRLSPNCSTPALLGPAAIALKSTEALVHDSLAALDGQRACDRVLRGFRQGVEEGLCGELTQGVVGVLVWQAVCGLLLLLLAAMLPALWHSHWLPPLVCDAEPWRRRLRRAMERSGAVAERLLPTEAAEEDPSLAPLGALPDASLGPAGSLATGAAGALLDLGEALDGARASGSCSSGAGATSAGAIPTADSAPPRRGTGGGGGGQCAGRWGRAPGEPL